MKHNKLFTDQTISYTKIQHKISIKSISIKQNDCSNLPNLSNLVHNLHDTVLSHVTFLQFFFMARSIVTS